MNFYLKYTLVYKSVGNSLNFYIKIFNRNTSIFTSKHSVSCSGISSGVTPKNGTEFSYRIHPRFKMPTNIQHFFVLIRYNFYDMPLFTIRIMEGTKTVHHEPSEQFKHIDASFLSQT